MRFESKILSKLPTVSLVSIGALTIAAGTISWRLRRERQNDNFPKVPPTSWIPGLGSTMEYFTSIVCFMERYAEKYQGPFKATILGRTWYFLSDPADVRKVFRSPERHISFYRAVYVVGGSLLPNEAVEGKHLSQPVKDTFRGKQFDGVSSTPFFVHALKHVPAWSHQLQEAFQYNFTNYLADEGEQDLFGWCMDLIGLATCRVMMKKDADIDAVKEWMRLVQECDVESALTGQGPIGTAKSFFDIALTGERPIFRQARHFVYPYILEEIEGFLADKPENGSVICSLVRSMAKKLNGKENPDYLREAKVRIATDLIFFTFAAITNSFGAAAWSLYHVLKDTEGCGQKIREEITQQTDVASTSDTLEMTILEITRLYTPANSFRYVHKPFQLESDPTKVIPTGSMIALNGALLGRQPDAYHDPCKFDPFRFDPSSSSCHKSVSDNFFGFGFGAHPCVGRKFAISEISIFVSEALKTFDFELVDSTLETKNENAVAMTKRMINNVPNHPILDPAQTNSIWRPIDPVVIKYWRKQ